MDANKYKYIAGREKEENRQCVLALCKEGRQNEEKEEKSSHLPVSCL